MKPAKIIPWLLAAILLCLCLILGFSLAADRGRDTGMGQLAPAAPGQTAQAGGRPFTIAWISDTQFYTAKYPEIFASMTGFLVDKAAAGQVDYVIHTGDVVDDSNDARQWETAKENLSQLSGKAPLLIAAGNHDVDNANLNYGPFRELLSGLNVSGEPYLGGLYKDGQARYDLVEIDGVPVILLSAGFGLRYEESEDMVAWMNQALKKYWNRFAILCLHSYMEPDCALTADGLVASRELVAQNPNVGLVLCGHHHGVNRLAAQFDGDGDGVKDRVVYQLLADYQAEAKGGGGYLALLTFSAEQGTISVKTYSPYLDDYNYYADNTGLETFTIPWTYPQ